MDREALEHSVKRGFQQEGESGDLSDSQWEAALSHTRGRKQRRWHWRSVAASPLRVGAAGFVLAVITGSVALWVAAPWEKPEPGAFVYGVAPAPGASGLPIPVPGPPGRPAPQYLETTWSVDRKLITPGEPLTVRATLKNVWDQRMEVQAFPQTATLDRVDTRNGAGAGVAVPLTVGGDVRSSIEPGEAVTFLATVLSDVTSGLQVGRYSVHFDFTFAHTPGKPEDGKTGLGLNSGVLFIVVPPEGALDRTVQVDAPRTAEDVAITLKMLTFAPEQSTVVALAVLPAQTPSSANGPVPLLAPTPTPVPTRTAGTPQTPPPGPPTPTPAPTPTPSTPSSPPGGYHTASASYRVDGGPWQEIDGLGYRETPEGVHLEWTLPPVSANAATFEFAVTGFDGRAGPWEWTVRLREPGQ